MNKQQLAQKIWASANQMRSKIEASEYKDFILGFIFYKYLSDKEIEFLKDNDYDDELLKTVTEDDPETVKWVQENIGYFISYKDFFSTWLGMGKDFDVSNVRDALSAFSRLISPTHKRVFEKIFNTLETGLSKLGDSSGTQTKAISGLLNLIKDIPMDGKQGYDVLGFIYEYLISMFAANAGKKAGEFYTPHEVSLLILLDGMDKIEIAKTESTLSEDIFARLADIPLIDKYEAYQLLDDHWNTIAVDLEMIQTEGFGAAKKVDPHLVTKKKGNDEQEVQDGWVGHILPFDLLQKTLLKDKAGALHALENQLAELPTEYEALLDEFTEDDKDAYKECFTEEGDAFVPKEIAKKVKELRRDRTPEAQNACRIFSRVEELTRQEKALKAEIKSDAAALEALTKKTIEGLTDAQVLELLEQKWIAPFTNELAKLPDAMVDSLVSKIQTLQNKYNTTFFDVESEIRATEKQLAAMMDDLTGSEYDLKGLSEFKTLLLGD